MVQALFFRCKAIIRNPSYRLKRLKHLHDPMPWDLVTLPLRAEKHRKLKESYRLKGLREKLVHHLESRGITDAEVLRAFLRVPRHQFLDTAFAEHAYEDKPFSIGEGQTISQPFTVAYQTSLLDVKPGLKVLEIGTGSGYQAAILAAMGANVYTVERLEALLARAEQPLAALGFEQVELYLRDGSEGLPEKAPFDRILVTASAPAVLPVYLDQLKPHGRMVIPVGDGEAQQMTRVTKLADGSYQEEHFDQFRFVPLKGKYGWK